MSSLLWVDDSHLEVTLFFSVIFCNLLFHQIVMISVIKLCRVVGLADLHGVIVLAFIPCVLSFSLNCAILTGFLFLLGCFNFLGIDGYCSPCVEVVLYNFLGISLFSELSIHCV
jgi:hypothetical protein